MQTAYRQQYWLQILTRYLVYVNGSQTRYKISYI